MYLAFVRQDLGQHDGQQLCACGSTRDRQVSAFSVRQAIPMVWDYAEANLFELAAELRWQSSIRVNLAADAWKRVNIGAGNWYNVDATIQYNLSVIRTVISTDPPYYDNIGHTLICRTSSTFGCAARLGQSSRNLFATLAVPKVEELVATPYRMDGSKRKAETFFHDGMTQAMHKLAEQSAIQPSGHYLLRLQAVRKLKGWVRPITRLGDFSGAGLLRAFRSAALGQYARS